MKKLPVADDPKLLVGFSTGDDAGVYRLTDDLAIVQTVDFFTPIVDDPFLYGQIAAANSLSDVYAMGGRPVSALTIVAFPSDESGALLEEIMGGGFAKMKEAGCTIAGGHSVRDDELKFGYAVTGIIDPRRIWRNVGARAGDVLWLTKPLGTGVLATALKKGQAREEYLRGSSASMVRLNRDAADALRDLEAASSGESPVHAVTDITGFGLLGHAREMASGSNVSFEIEHLRAEYLSGALESARAGHLAGGLINNREWLEGCVKFDATIPEEYRLLLYDPQTSGGLLAAVAGEASSSLRGAMKRHGVDAREIGRVREKSSPLLHVG